MTRSLAGEYGFHNIRVNCLRASAMPGTHMITLDVTVCAGVFVD